VVEKLCAMFKFMIFAEKKLFNPALVALTTMPRNEAKIKKRIFLALKGISNFVWLLTHLNFFTGRCEG